MASVNRWIGIGNTGKDPEVRYAPDGTCFAKISLACNESWKDKVSGDKKEKTEWIPISFAGKLAEIVAQYVKAGASLYVEGKFTTRKWQDKDGQDRYATEIRADVMQMLGSKSESHDRPARQERQSEPARQSAPAESGGFGNDEFDDSIPF